MQADMVGTGVPRGQPRVWLDIQTVWLPQQSAEDGKCPRNATCPILSQPTHLSIRIASVRRSFSSHVSFSSAMIFSVSWQGMVKQGVRAKCEQHSCPLCPVLLQWDTGPSSRLVCTSCSSISPTSFHQSHLQRVRHKHQPLHSLSASPPLHHAGPGALLPSQARGTCPTGQGQPSPTWQHQEDPTTPKPSVWASSQSVHSARAHPRIASREDHPAWASRKHRAPSASCSALRGKGKGEREGGKEKGKGTRAPASYLEPFNCLLAAWSKHDALVQAGDRGSAAGQGREGGRGADPSDGVGHCGEIVMAVTQLCPSSIVIVLKVGHIYGRGRRDGPGRDTQTG